MAVALGPTRQTEGVQYGLSTTPELSTKINAPCRKDVLLRA